VNSERILHPCVEERNPASLHDTSMMRLPLANQGEFWFNEGTADNMKKAAR
jgi:hypothetical protein